MTKEELKELMKENQIDVRFDTIEEVEDFLNGWDFLDFLDYDWHEKDAISSDRYYEVVIRRQEEEEEPEDDNYYVEVSAYELNNTWISDGNYSEVINYQDLLEMIDKRS